MKNSLLLPIYFVTLNFYLVIITSFIIQVTIWYRFPILLTSFYIPKAPIITTTRTAQKNERIYNSHVMNFCIHSLSHTLCNIHSCDYWPQALVLNGSACAFLPLNCLFCSTVKMKSLSIHPKTEAWSALFSAPPASSALAESQFKCFVMRNNET